MPEVHSGTADEDFWHPALGDAETEHTPHITCMQLVRDYGLLGLTFACAETSRICEICQMWVLFYFAQLQNKLHLGFERRYI